MQKPGAGAELAGGVRDTLLRMRGVWHDRVEIFDLAGAPLVQDEQSATPGAAPFDNLVYVDFDGLRYRQTNVTFRGRPLHFRSFGGELKDGVLVFDALGPGAPEHIGVSGGPGVLIFGPRRVNPGWSRYYEPDWVRLTGPGQRIRTTLLYRDGVALRALSAEGQRIGPCAARRLDWDPRGAEGPVHEPRSEAYVWK